MGVPDTTNLTLHNVVDVLDEDDNLVGCFNDAIAANFDLSYSGAKDNLLNFRNYDNGFSAWIVTDISLSQTQALASRFYNNNVADGQVYIDVTGDRLFIVDFVNTRVRHYSFATPNDITSTFTFIENSPSLSYNFTNFTFKSDGTKMYFLDSGSDRIYEHDIVKDAFDISTLDTTASSFVSMPSSVNQSFSFNRTGTELYVVYKSPTPGTTVTNATYALSTAWDLSTAASPATAIITSSITNPQDGAVYIYEQNPGPYDHWVVFGALNADFRDGITISDINSSTTIQQIASPAPSCINNALIYDVQRTGTSAPYTFTLRKYLTNV